MEDIDQWSFTFWPADFVKYYFGHAHIQFSYRMCSEVKGKENNLSWLLKLPFIKGNFTDV